MYMNVLSACTSVHHMHCVQKYSYFISPETGVADGYESSSEHWKLNLEGRPLLQLLSHL